MKRNRTSNLPSYNLVKPQEILTSIPKWFESSNDSSAFMKTLKSAENRASSKLNELDIYFKDLYNLGLDNPHEFYLHTTQPTDVQLVDDHILSQTLPNRYTKMKDILSKKINTWDMNPTLEYLPTSEKFRVQTYTGQAIQIYEFDRYFDLIVESDRVNNVFDAQKIEIKIVAGQYTFVTNDEAMKVELTTDAVDIVKLTSQLYDKFLDLDHDGVMSNSDYISLAMYIGTDITTTTLPAYIDTDRDGIFTQKDYELLAYRYPSAKNSGVYLYTEDANITNAFIEKTTTKLIVENDMSIVGVKRTNYIKKVVQMPTKDYMFLENGILYVSTSLENNNYTLEHLYNSLLPYAKIHDFDYDDGLVYVCIESDSLFYIGRFSLDETISELLIFGLESPKAVRTLPDDKLMIISNQGIEIREPRYDVCTKIGGQFLTLSDYTSDGFVGTLHKNVQLYDTFAYYLGLDRFVGEEPYQFISRVREYMLRGENSDVDNIRLYYATILNPDLSVLIDLGRIYGFTTTIKTFILGINSNTYECKINAKTNYISVKINDTEEVIIGKVLGDYAVLYNSLRRFINATGDCSITVNTNMGLFNYTVYLVYNKYIPLHNLSMAMYDTTKLLSNTFLRNLFNKSLFQNKSSLGFVQNGFSDIDAINYSGVYPDGMVNVVNEFIDKRLHRTDVISTINDSRSFSNPEAILINVPKTNDIIIIDDIPLSKNVITDVKNIIGEGPDVNTVCRARLGTFMYENEFYHYIGVPVLLYGHEIKYHKFPMNTIYYEVFEDVLLDKDVDGRKVLNDCFVKCINSFETSIVDSSLYLIDKYPYSEITLSDVYVESGRAYIMVGNVEKFNGNLLIDDDQIENNVSIIVGGSTASKTKTFEIRSRRSGEIKNSHSNIWGDPEFNEITLNATIENSNVSDIRIMKEKLDTPPAILYSTQNTINDIFIRDISLNLTLKGFIKNGFVDVFIDGLLVPPSQIQFNKKNNIQRLDKYHMTIDIISPHDAPSKLAIPTYEELENVFTKPKNGVVVYRILLLKKFFLDNEEYISHNISTLIEQLDSNNISFLKENNLLDITSSAYRTFVTYGMLDESNKWVILSIIV